MKTVTMEELFDLAIFKYLKNELMEGIITANVNLWLRHIKNYFFIV